jgi:hypothetical protein
MTKEQIKQLANSGYSDYEIQEIIENLNKKYPLKPAKPNLSVKHTSEQAIQYANDLAKYEQNIIEYEKEVYQVDKHNYELDSLFVEYLEEKSGMTSLSEEEQTLIRELMYEYVSKSNGRISYYQDVKTFVDFVNDIKRLNNGN